MTDEQLFRIELTGMELTTLVILLRQQFELIAASNSVSERGKVEKITIIHGLCIQLEQAFDDQVKCP